MASAKIIRCSACNAALDVEMNRAYIFCKYCGCKNIIEDEQIKTNINIQGVSFSAKTDVESIIASAQYAISMKQYDKANELIMTTILSGTNDYRIYSLRVQIDLLIDDNKSLFETMDILRRLEEQQGPNREVTNEINRLMHFRGAAGVTILHNATFNERMDYVVYCVEHGSDVNLVAGMNRVTPISIMFVHVSSSLCGIDGTPFVHHKEKVKEIRRYLMAHGARDTFRLGY
ncbi:MAG: hypothetical protein K6C99_10980 [Lachnospiraceae bacterium]|nr:hypothetical protein [Lachnospiraceae bacterium]